MIAKVTSVVLRVFVDGDCRVSIVRWGRPVRRYSPGSASLLRLSLVMRDLSIDGHFEVLPLSNWGEVGWRAFPSSGSS